MITLERAYLPNGFATFGRLILPDGWHCYTLENPWRLNTRSVSCIPEGVYPLAMRKSPVVKRTTGDEFDFGWEITEVPDRDHIMIHPGNWTHNTDGCVLPGRSFHWHHEHGPMVTNSGDAFRQFMERMSGELDEYFIDIRPITVSYP